MAKKKTPEYLSKIIKEHRNIITNGMDILAEKKSYKAVSISPAIDIALGAALKRVHGFQDLFKYTIKIWSQIILSRKVHIIIFSFLRLLMSDYPCIHCEELLSSHCECGICPFT